MLFTPPRDHGASAAGPRRLRRGSAVGARRDRSRSNFSAGPAGIGSADWSAFMDQWPSAAKWGLLKLKLRADPHRCGHSNPTQKTLLHPRADPLRVGVNAPTPLKQIRPKQMFQI